MIFGQQIFKHAIIIVSNDDQDRDKASLGHPYPNIPSVRDRADSPTDIIHWSSYVGMTTIFVVQKSKLDKRRKKISSKFEIQN